MPYKRRQNNLMLIIAVFVLFSICVPMTYLVANSLDTSSSTKIDPRIALTTEAGTWIRLEYHKEMRVGDSLLSWRRSDGARGDVISIDGHDVCLVVWTKPELLMLEPGHPEYECLEPAHGKFMVGPFPPGSQAEEIE